MSFDTEPQDEVQNYRSKFKIGKLSYAIQDNFDF